MYLPGATEFYARFPDDPWTAAHSKLETALTECNGDSYFAAMVYHLTEFERTIANLIEKYRPFSPGDTSFQERAFYSTKSVDAFMADESMRSKRCSVCGTDEGVRIARHHIGGLGLYCQECQPADKKK